MWITVFRSIVICICVCGIASSLSQADRRKQKGKEPYYQVDPDVLRDHKARFGTEVLERRSVENSKHKLETAIVPTFVKPSSPESKIPIFPDPPKENLKASKDKEKVVDDGYELPFLPQYPTPNHYQATTFSLTDIFPAPIRKKYQWGKTEPDRKPYRWGKY